MGPTSMTFAFSKTNLRNLRKIKDEDD